VTAQQLTSIRSRSKGGRPALAAIIVCASLFLPHLVEAWQLQAGQASLPASSVGSSYQWVAFPASFDEVPVVFVVPTAEGSEPASLRVRNVSLLGFELVQAEAPNADGPHEAMVVDWIAATPGTHELPDGTILEVGTLSTSAVQHGSGVTGTESWSTLAFAATFTAPPAVLLTIQSDANETAVVPDDPPVPWLVAGIKNVTASGFNIALERCEAAPGTVTSSEVIGYMAIVAGRSGTFTADDASSVDFKTFVTADAISGWDAGCFRSAFQSAFSATPLVVAHLNRHDGGEGGWLRRCSVDATGVEFTVDEDTYRDSERGHTQEAAGVLAFSRAFTATFGIAPIDPDASFSSATFSVNEAVAQVDLTVTLSEAASGDVSIDWATGTGTATPGADYTPASDALVIPQGDTSGVITITILPDLDPEPYESFPVALSNALGAILVSPSTTTVTIIDDDSPPRVVVYSVGDTSNQLSSAVNISISAGIATFSGDTPGFDPKPGDRIMYDTDNKVVFVSSCSSNLTCEVVVADGLVPGDVGSVAVSEYRAEFGALTTAVAAAGDASHLNTHDLVSGNLALEIACYATGSADTSFVNITGWTTDASHTITIQTPSSDRHDGKWTDSAYRLEVSGGPCLKSSVGDLVISGLQLYCSADAATDVAAVSLDGTSVNGRVEVSETIIRLDGADGSGERLGISAPDVGTVSLVVKNIVLYDLGSGTDRHAGLLVEDTSLTARVLSTTIVGGAFGIRQTAGAVSAINTIAVGSGTAGFSGMFQSESASNAADDGTAPGTGSFPGTTPPFSGPLTGASADLHLSCGIPGLATVTSSLFDIGIIDDVFDGNPRTLARTAGENPAFVQLEFADPVLVSSAAVSLSHANQQEWSLAVADSAADMATQSGSFAVAIPTRIVDGLGLPDPGWVWDSSSFTPTLARVIRLDVYKYGDPYVHIDEWELGFEGVCGGAMDLSADATDSFAVDVDGDLRVEPWDVGADEATVPSMRSVEFVYEIWEVEGEAVVDVLLSNPVPADVEIAYWTLESSAIAGLDFVAVEGSVTISAGSRIGQISVPVLDDGVSDDAESFDILFDYEGASGGSQASTTVILRDGTRPNRVFFSNPVVTTNEPDGFATVNVSLLDNAVGDVTVNWEANDGSARLSQDYGATQGALTILDGQASGTLVVPIYDDGASESTETILVNLFAPSGARLGSPALAEIQIIDDEVPSVSFSQTAYTIGEASGTATIGVELSEILDHPVTVEYSTSDGTATAGSDYQPTSGVVTIPDGFLTRSFDVVILDDGNPESDETVQLALANAEGAVLGSSANATLTIQDDDALPVVSLSSASAQVAENGGSIELTITLSEIHDQVVSVDVTTFNGTASAASDYVAVAETAFIPIGSLSAPVTIQILDDGIFEGDEHFTVDLSNPNGADLGSPTTATVTITENDPAPSIGFSAGSSSVDETAGTTGLTVQLTVPTSLNVTVDYTTTNGTAVAGTDYVAASDTLTIPAGELSGVIPVTIIDDTDPEGDEDFSVNLANPVGAGLGAIPARDVTILDDDSALPGWLLEAGSITLPATGSGSTFVAVSFGQTYPAAPVVVTLIGMDDTAPAAVRIRNVTPSGFELVQVEPGGADGDHGAEVVHWLAVEQGQHVLADGTLIEAGTIDTMAVQHGTGVTGTESWQSLSYGSSFAAPPVFITELQSMNNEVATLPENPSEPWLVVGVRNVTTLSAEVALERCESAPGSVSIPETIGYVAIDAGRSGTFTADDAGSVAYETLNTPDSIVGPSCVQVLFASAFPAPPLVIGHQTRHDGGDGGWLRRCAFTATAVTLVVDEDQYRDTERSHGTEAAGVLLFERPFVAEIGGGGPGLPVVALASATASVDENDGSVDITVVLSATSDSDVTVDCATADLTANGGSDFVPLSEPVTIPSGQISGVATVSITDDLVAEGTEEFLVSISNPAGATLGTPESTTVTIVDNEPVPTVAFSTSAQSIDEDAGLIGLAVLVSAPSSHDITVHYAAADGTAVGGSDYVAVSDTLTIPAGELTGVVPVTIIDDGLPEDDEVFTVALSAPVGAALTSPDTATVTIVDDEVPTVSLSTASLLVAENDGSVVVEAVLSHIHNQDVTVFVASSNGSAVAGLDYVAVQEQLTIPSGEISESVAVPITDDVIAEGPEDFSVSISNPVNAELGTQTSTIVTITDNEPVPSIAFSSSEARTAEVAGVIDLTVQISGVSSHDITVHYATADGTAVGGSDYVAVSDTLTIPAGELTGVLSVTIIDDGLPEDEEVFTVALSAPVGALLSSPDTATVTIVGAYPIPVITEPVNGAVYYGSYGVDLDASASVVPPGFEVWFAALVNDGSNPMVAVYTTDQLTGSFTASNAHPSYRVRLVVAAPGTMPADPVLRGLASPCNLVSSGYRCDTAEVTITRFPYVLPYPFETVYALPEGVFLRWGQRPNVQMERSADGGVNWTNLGLTTNDDYYFEDNTISEGVTYHYRARPGASSPWVYLGSTLEALGNAVPIPEWNAPRIIPQLDDVTWHCPQGALRYLCDGTLHMRLQTETGRSLSEATIRVFLNEETFQLSDGNGDEIHTVFDTSGGSLHDFVGYDLPGCVVRKATSDLEVQVPFGQEEIAVDLPEIVFGANGLRLEVVMPNGDISERAILIALLDEPVQEDHRAFYGHFEPVLFGSTLTSSDPELWGFGPVSRYSPDCRDGDSWYYFDHWPDYITALFFNQVDFGASTNQSVFTDEQGVWTHTFTGLTDGIHALRPEPPGVYPPDGSLGRAISNPATGYFNEDYAHFLSTESYGTYVDITIDSAYADVTPQLSHVDESIVIDSADPVELGVVRFRVADADQNLDMTTVRAYNCDLESCTPGQPGQTPYWGFYADNQWGGDDGHYGWFVVELPLAMANDGLNELVFCASDALGDVLGTPTDPCVSAIVTRESPLVYASITEPQENSVYARPGAIIELDGSTSVFPEGGVGVWTIGVEYSLILGWQERTTADPVGDPSDLRSSVVMHTGSLLGHRARLIVAATPGDLPADYWPTDGSLPCVRSQGDGSCDSAEVTLISTCSYDPGMAGVVMDSPSGFTNVAPDESLQLTAHVASPPLSPFAYRWVVYDDDDTYRQWPITTLGYGDAGEGFSTQNNDLLISPASYGLEPGDYTLVVEARYPVSGCESGWYFGASTPVSLRVGNTLDGVAPGMVVEGGRFRVYSQTWTEGASGVVFIDDDTGDANPPLAYEGIVQPGGYIEITPDPLDLPAIGTYWFVSVADDLDGTAQSTWVNALQVEPAGDAGSPLVVSNEEDVSCGGAGTECAHPMLPGQTWRGEWGEAGDRDGFTFLAGAGTEVAITLDRVDLILPPQHPDAPAPEIHLAGPDGVVHDVSEPLALDATGTSLTATVTTGGRQTILVRTSKGAGQYLVTLNVTAEGGSGQPAFGFTPERSYLTTEARPDATLSTPLLDPFGNPITGARVSWEQGAVCGMGDFCGNGTTTTVRSSTDGFAMLEVATAAGADPLWKPSVTLAPSLKHQPVERPGVAERLARARAEHTVLGVVRTSGRALVATDLTDPATAKELTAEARKRALARDDAGLKNGPFCPNHTLACPSSGELVFRAAQLALDPGDDLIDVEVRILDGGVPTELLDGYTILEPVPLALEIEATVRDGQGGERQVMLTEPAAVTVSDGTGGAISDGITTCGGLEIPAVGFTYLNGPHAGIRYAYDEPDGSPCCWQTTELLQARVVVDAEVDDGQGGTIRVTKRAEALVESRPRPADPCEIQPWPPGFAGQTPLIAGTGSMPLAAGETSAIDMVGEVYSVDACGNIAYLAPTDPQITVTGLSPQPPDVWAEVVQSPASWTWYLFLRSLNCTSPPCDPDDLYFVPDGLYDIGLGISGASSCDGGGTPAYVQSIDYSASRPVIQLKWEQGGDEPVPPMASPGSALRNPATGELIAWRVRPGGPIRYTDVPVRLYVGEALIYHDSDGNIVESFRKVEDAEICVGEVHWHYDPDACPDPGCNVRTVTCDQVFTGETTVLAYTEPEWSGGYFDGPIGVAAGVSKVPDQAGSYYLIAEPLDEAFRRGDAWMVATEVIWTLGGDPYYAGTYRKAFEVGGGFFLDELWRPITEEIRVDAPTPIHLLTSLSHEQQSSQFEFAVEEFGQVLATDPFDLIPYSAEKFTAPFLLLAPDMVDPGGFEGATRVDVPGWWATIRAQVAGGSAKVGGTGALAEGETIGGSKITFVDLDPSKESTNPENFRFLIRKDVTQPFAIPGGFQSVGGVSPAQTDWTTMKVRVTVDGLSQFERDRLDLYVWVEDPPDPSPYVASPHEGDNIKSIGGFNPPRWNPTGGWSEECEFVENPCLVATVSSASSVDPDWLVFDQGELLLYSGDNFIFKSRAVATGVSVLSERALSATSGEVFVWKVKSVRIAEMMKKGFTMEGTAAAGSSAITVKMPPWLNWTDHYLQLVDEIQCSPASLNGGVVICGEPRPQIRVFDALNGFRTTPDLPYVGSVVFDSESPTTLTLELRESEFLDDPTEYQLQADYTEQRSAGVAPIFGDRWRLLDVTDDTSSVLQSIYTTIDWPNLSADSRLILPKLHLNLQNDGEEYDYPEWAYDKAETLATRYANTGDALAAIALLGDAVGAEQDLAATRARITTVLTPRLAATAPSYGVDERRVQLDVVVHELDHNLALQQYVPAPGQDPVGFHCDELIGERADIPDGTTQKCIGYASITAESLQSPLPVFGMGCLINGFPQHPGSNYAGRKDDEF
jgi:hypothetical protein